MGERRGMLMGCLQAIPLGRLVIGSWFCLVLRSRRVPWWRRMVVENDRGGVDRGWVSYEE
jgi:hypothetical protein